MNILIFGPNGSGKGTQGAIVQKKYSVPHIETGVIFRDNIKKGTELGKKAKAFIDRGDLVPDDITIPMILNRLKEPDCKSGWLLDGFPRNLAQAEALWKALQNEKMKLDSVIEIMLSRDIAKKRIMGRRLCPVDNNHPNNVFIDAIKPAMKNGKMVCRVCGAENLATRADDQDEVAIDKRHGIYYDTKTGTLAAVNYYRDRVKVISVDGTPGVKEVSQDLMGKLG
jgi:adenylate kinase